MLYETLIQPAFNEMVDKIVFTYKFTTLPNIEELRDECKIWLTTILDKFDPTSGSKAFSYFSVITKNWFIHKVKKTAEQNKREVGIEEITDPKNHEVLIVEHTYFSNREQDEFWREFWYEINSWEHVDMKPNERRVVEEDGDNEGDSDDDGEREGDLELDGHIVTGKQIGRASCRERVCL